MPVSISVEYPDDNELDLDPWFLEQGRGFIQVKGKGNRLQVRRPFSVGGAHFVLDGGVVVEVEEGCGLSEISVHALAQGVSIQIGARTAFNGLTHITAHEPARIYIGSECLFAPECSISASDVHKIYDCKTNERLNPAGDIFIGDRVWLGARVVVFRNSLIGSDSVVGWASVVKGEFPSNVLLAGAPAKIVKTGIRWEP